MSLSIPDVVPAPGPEAVSDSGVAALFGSAGFGVALLDDIAWIGVTGEDRVRWLNGMTTNSIEQLKPGEGCYNFILSAQGRIQGDGYAFVAPTELLIETGRAQSAKLLELLNRFIIMDDVELQDASHWGLLCAGPKAAAALRALGIDSVGMGQVTRRGMAWRGIEMSLIYVHSPLVPRFEIWVDAPGEREAVRSALMEAGAAAMDAAALEQLRILEGTPRYGIDITDRELPQETGQVRALHFAKGCYLGQEIVERIRSRGAVHRVFQSFRLEGAMAQPGDAILTESKEAGVLTSVAMVPLDAGTVQLGLGYIRREALDRGVPLRYRGEGREGVASVVEMPFHAPPP